MKTQLNRIKGLTFNHLILIGANGLLLAMIVTSDQRFGLNFGIVTDGYSFLSSQYNLIRQKAYPAASERVTELDAYIAAELERLGLDNAKYETLVDSDFADIDAINWEALRQAGNFEEALKALPKSSADYDGVLFYNLPNGKTLTLKRNENDNSKNFKVEIR